MIKKLWDSSGPRRLFYCGSRSHVEGIDISVFFV